MRMPQTRSPRQTYKYNSIKITKVAQSSTIITVATTVAAVAVAPAAVVAAVIAAVVAVVAASG